MEEVQRIGFTSSSDKPENSKEIIWRPKYLDGSF
jgi:hypothetical protein